MKLTKEQAQEIKDQQSQEHKTKESHCPRARKNTIRGNSNFRPRIYKSG